jgi:hypothetical protein
MAVTKFNQPIYYPSIYPGEETGKAVFLNSFTERQRVRKYLKKGDA